MISRLADRAVPTEAKRSVDAFVLPGAVALALGTFALDVRFGVGTLTAAGYGLAMLASLWSGRLRHALVSAALAVALILLAPVLAIQAPERGRAWLEHLPIALMVIGIAAFGLANVRRAVRESRALAQAERDGDADRAALERAREAENRLERASRSSLAGHWELDYVKGTRWHSASFQALLGYEEKALTDSVAGATEQTHPDHRQRSYDAFAHYQRTGAPYDVTVPLRTADGSYRWYRMRGGAELAPDGRVLRVSGSVQDVHLQKIAEDRLHVVQARFERAVQGTQDGLWEIDLTGSSGRVWLSPRMHEILGYAEGELSDNQTVLRGLVHPSDLALFDAAVERQLENAAAIDIEVRMRTKSGEYRWYRMRGSPGVDADGRVIRSSGSMQDVGESRAAREALVRATEAAEAASRAKSSFLATMSHEIRTPMNGIIGMTALLLDTVLGRVQREYAEAIHTSANSLLAIINDVLDFSKIEAGKLATEAVEMDLRSNVEDVGALMALQAAQKHLELIVHVHDDVPQMVRSDPQRIRQCLLNLVGNAVKFTSRGEIVLEVRAHGRRDDKSLVRFEVRDTGIGISSEARLDLFRPFTQADSSTTRKFGGTGLGLSIVKRLIEILGGEIGVESEPGRGSTFWFELPLERIEPSGRSAQLRLQGDGRKVLVVDDNESSRRALSAHLQSFGFTVRAVAGGALALEELRRAAQAGAPYEAALIDHQMPDIDGGLLGEQIAADSSLAGLRRILLTSLERASDPAHFAGLGFAAYLTKPVRARELRECLEQVLLRGGEGWNTGTHALVTPGALTNATAQRQYVGYVLVVEDNPVNQKVAEKFLERMGCRVRVANDGVEAVEACAQERFDLVLMDMQMPRMDGLTATRAVRAGETGGARAPIVALTANALAGQFQSCIEAGMDDVLTKPLEVARLAAVLDRFLAPLPDATAPRLRPVGPELGSAPLDLARLANLAGADTAFMSELIGVFRTSAARLLTELRQALVGPDRPALMREAHKLKGASANVGATRLCELCLRLESLATAGEPRDLEICLEAIAAELAELNRFFSRADFATIFPRYAS